jgi:hypothetical protein
VLFCDSMESVEHLFLSCPFTRICRIVYFTYNIPPPTNITNMFGKWLNGINKMNKARIRMGVSALCWSIWTCKYHIVFYKEKGINFLHVIRLAMYWIQTWFLILPVDRREPMVTGCNRLQMVTHNLYFQLDNGILA